MRRYFFFVVLFFISVLQRITFGLELEIIGPSGGTLAPDTEYGFGVWIRNPGAWWDDTNPDLKLYVSGAVYVDASKGTFDFGNIGSGYYHWYSEILPKAKGLIGYILLRTESSGTVNLQLDGQINGIPFPVTGYDEKNYAISDLTGECWDGLNELANSRASTNLKFAYNYTSLCNVTTPPVSGYELYSALTEEQANAIRSAQLLGTLLEGLLNPASGISNILLQVEQNWVGIPDFLGVFMLWDTFENRNDRYQWYYFDVLIGTGLTYPLGPVGMQSFGYLNLIYDSQVNEAIAWQNENPSTALTYLSTEETYVTNALKEIELCITFAENNNDIQGVDFFSGMQTHLQAELNVIEKLKDTAQALIPPVADFSGAPISGVAPLGINFTDGSTGSITSWYWTFGDGNTSDATNPSHTYIDPGDYTVSLQVTGPMGTDTEIKTNYIHVNPQQISVTVEALPSGKGLDVIVDGIPYNESHTFYCDKGSPHIIEAPTPQTGNNGVYIYSYWNDGGSRIHTITPQSSGTYVAVYDYASNITVTYPNGGETWYVGELKNITWSSQIVSGNVNIEISRDGGSTWSSIINNTANDSSHPWTVTYPSSSQCRIRVSSVSFPDESDTSNSNFTVVPYQYEGPYVHWKFDEPWNGVTVLDSSGLNNHGTIINGDVGVSSYQSGYINNGLELNNGQNINSQNGDRVALNYVLTDSGTITLWMKPHAIYNYNTVFDNSGDSNDWEMWIYANSSLRFRVQADSYVTANLNNLTDGDVTNDWVHVAVTWERLDTTSVRIEMYINGEFIQSDTGAWVEPGAIFYLGGGNSNNEAGYAEFDDFRIYARVLSACEILQIHWFGDNTPPVVDAGPDLPDAWMDESGNVTRSIDATVSDLIECDGSVVDEYDVQWTKISGPSDIVIHSPEAEDTQITISTPGAYVLQLEADDGEFIVSDTMALEVFPMAYTGLLVHWPFDDGQYNPTVTDTSGNGNNGTWVDGVDGITTIVPGRLGKSLQLEHADNIKTTGDYISLPQVLSHEGSIALWYKVFSLYNYVTIFDNHVNYGDWEMWIYGSGVLRGRVQSGTEVSANLHALAPDGDAIGDWFHMIFTWKRTSDTTVDTQLYVNGDLIDQASGPWVDPGTHFYIGSGNVDNEGPDGIFDDVRIYQHSMFPGEAKLLASLSDHNEDRSVDMMDLKELINRWLTSNPDCDSTPPFDYDMNCNVDMKDYSNFVRYWLLRLE